ncbi:MAG: TIM barrel protein [Planctomycetia bacterium]
MGAMFRNLSTIGLPLSGRPSELIELALSFGFDSMDIDIIDFQQQAEVYGVEHARRLMVSARLKSGLFHLPLDLGADDAAFDRDLSLLPKRLELAQATEAFRAAVTITPATEQHSFKDFFELHRKRLDSVGELLAKHGIMLGLAIQPETEASEGKGSQFVNTYEGLLGLVAASHPSIGAIIDSWALHVTGEGLDTIAKVPQGRIVEVRLSDAPRDVRGVDLHANQRLLPGDAGTINNSAVLTHAREAGFEGPVTPWADRSAVTGRGREKIVKLAGDRVDAVWREAGLPIVPRWFMPVAKEGAPVFGEPLIAGAE